MENNSRTFFETMDLYGMLVALVYYTTGLEVVFQLKPRIKLPGLISFSEIPAIMKDSNGKFDQIVQQTCVLDKYSNYLRIYFDPLYSCV